MLKLFLAAALALLTVLPASAQLTLTVEERDCSGGFQISTTALPAAILGQPYVFQLQAICGLPPYTWKRSGGKLPKGIRVTRSGSVEGTPEDEGDFDFVVEVVDSNKSDKKVEVK